ncbi:NAD-dependent epimerase/dehydratase family protein [Candidatus Woesearchaeota archaeon]|nr:NAD-dependent epimerase/dehydratase family protein [Candidatus Woesearchaeota archaeon]
MKILITGGAGFIGTNIAASMLDRHEIVAYDNITRNALKHFREVYDHKNFRLVTADVLDREKLASEMEGSDVVMHLAAIAGVSNYFKQPVKTMQVNFLGTLSALEAAKKAEPKLFINMSTSETYGVVADHVKETDNTSQGPAGELRFTYSVSKLAGEHLCFAYHKQYGLPVVSLRPFNIYGPGQVGEGAIQRFVTAALKNESISITGDGSQVRSWCYITDLVRAVQKVLDNKSAIGNLFNIGNADTEITIKELADKIIKLSSSKSKTKFVEGMGADVIYRVPNVEKAKKLLGWSPEVGLDEGIRKSIDWYDKND